LPSRSVACKGLACSPIVAPMPGPRFQKFDHKPRVIVTRRLPQAAVEMQGTSSCDTMATP